MTYEDYLLLPDDGKRHEIISGEHFMTPSPSTRHQLICGSVYRALCEHARRADAGTVIIAPIDVVLSDGDVVQPDVLFVAADRAAILTEKNVAGPPDLVVEILSESTRKADLTVKYKLYAARGVREYWVVDPAIETLVIHRAGKDGFARAAELSREAGDSASTPLLPGLALALSEIFV